MFCYSTMFYIYLEEIDFDHLLGVCVGDNLNIVPLNKSVFCWKNLRNATKQLRFKIKSFIETEQN
jgi:hypothetical protein